MTDIRRRYLKLAIWTVFGSAAAIGLVVLLKHSGDAFIAGRVGLSDRDAKAAGNPLPTTAKSPAVMPLHDAPREVPDIHFEDGSGRRLMLADFRGKAILLNIWATWCAPCRKEMPTLDRLQEKLGGADFEVVALSIDRAGVDAVRRFYGEIGIERLAIYADPSAKAARDLGVAGIPVTLLVGRDGRELGRLVGPAEWNTPEMIDSIGRLLAKQRSSADRIEPRFAAIPDAPGASSALTGPLMSTAERIMTGTRPREAMADRVVPDRSRSELEHYK